MYTKQLAEYKTGYTAILYSVKYHVVIKCKGLISDQNVSIAQSIENCQQKLLNLRLVRLIIILFIYSLIR